MARSGIEISLVLYLQWKSGPGDRIYCRVASRRAGHFRTTGYFRSSWPKHPPSHWWWPDIDVDPNCRLRKQCEPMEGGVPLQLMVEKQRPREVNL